MCVCLLILCHESYAGRLFLGLDGDLYRRRRLLRIFGPIGDSHYDFDNRLGEVGEVADCSHLDEDESGGVSFSWGDADATIDPLHIAVAEKREQVKYVHGSILALHF